MSSRRRSPSRLEGRCRPGHFRGVATIVLKLFHLVPADEAFFGQKDYQQSRVIETMAQDLNVPIRVVVCPMVREADGLAMSSRNRYLSGAEAQQALAISRSLARAAELYRGGMREAAVIRQETQAVLEAADIARIDYVAVVDRRVCSKWQTVDDDTMVLIAAFVGGTRLIDNRRLGEGCPVRSTLFHIPHADPVWGIPLFGFGWLLLVVVAAA